MSGRWTQLDPASADHLAARMDDWAAGEGIDFLSPAAEAAYLERAGLIRAALRLEEPERIPACPSPANFPIQHGGITAKDAHYNTDRLSTAWTGYYRDFQPDAYHSPGTFVDGHALETLGTVFYRWPGGTLDDNTTFQYAEAEYMKADEYHELIDDPTGFFISTVFPRFFSNLKGLTGLPPLPAAHEMPTIPLGITPFGRPEVRESVQALLDAGEQAATWAAGLGRLNRSIIGQGFPLFSGGFSKAPFDVIGDQLRGTVGIMTDMFRHPDLLLEACERLVPLMVKSGLVTARNSGHFLIFMPLHKGADGFMSDQQFQTFYWPTLKKVCIGLMNHGLMPLLFAEGSYNSRLETVRDLPSGRAAWLLDKTDMAAAKRTIGQTACLSGNVPLDLLCTATPDQVADHCRELISTAAPGGGFILSTGAGMDGVKAENVRAMMESVR